MTKNPSQCIYIKSLGPIKTCYTMTYPFVFPAEKKSKKKKHTFERVSYQELFFFSTFKEKITLQRIRMKKKLNSYHSWSVQIHTKLSKG